MSFSTDAGGDADAVDAIRIWNMSMSTHHGNAQRML